MSDFFTERLYVNCKDNPDLGWKTKSGVRNTEDAFLGYKYRELNKFHIFYLKISRVHVFCSNFSQACMF